MSVHWPVQVHVFTWNDKTQYMKRLCALGTISRDYINLVDLTNEDSSGSEDESDVDLPTSVVPSTTQTR